jgi:chemotaxis protein MotA
VDAECRRLRLEMRSLSEAYYAQGPAALSSLIASHPLPAVWRQVSVQLEGRIPLADIRALLQYDAQNLEDEVNAEIALASSLSSVAPSIGLLGTVVGLIRLLAGLTEISTLGANMSLALVTALYGIFFSVVLLNPLVTRLMAIRDGLLKCHQQALFWVYLMENRKPSFYCEGAAGPLLARGGP